ncbi:MAG: hypothetical protein HY675_04385 [Chloroflexi bacterium]|nr:hypothetical protein [Chloroflexota bacterium]
MIVRILTEGQYRLSSGVLDKLNEIDNDLVNVVASGDQKKYEKLLSQMIDLVRKKGQPLKPDEIVESELILPSPDTTLEEAKSLFTGDGLIPG